MSRSISQSSSLDKHPTASLSPLGYGRESSANARFGTRLLNPDFSHSHPRPASRRTQATPTSRRFANSEDSLSTTRATVTTTPPTWDSSTRAVTTTPMSSRSRTRNTSQTSDVGPREDEIPYSACVQAARGRCQVCHPHRRRMGQAAAD